MSHLSEADRLERAVKCLRLFLRDRKELNRLLGGEFESSDDELRMAVSMALDDWNTSPPPLGRSTLANHPAKHLLLMKAAAIAISGAGLWHSREHLPSSDGGTSADDHAKGPEYSAWADRMNAEYSRMRDDKKLSLNITAGFRNMGAPSEYAWFSWYGPDLRW